MSWIVGILSVFLVLTCLLLMLLVLIQLPKKEAGMGQAFGGGTTDALFGAGSGTALTKMTKYTAGIFFAITLLLWILKAQEVKNSRSSLERTIQQIGKTERTAPPVTPNAAPSTPKAATPVSTNVLVSSTATNPTMLLTAPSNVVPKVGTNAPVAEEPPKTK